MRYVVPQREEGIFSYLITTRFKEDDSTVETEKSYKSFVELNEALHPYIVVVAFPRGMRTPFPDDRVSSWFFGDSSERSVKRATDLTNWLIELVSSEKLMVVRDAHEALATFLNLRSFSVGMATGEMTLLRDGGGAAQQV